MKVVVAGSVNNCRKHLINIIVYFKDVNFFVTYKDNLYHNENNAAEFIGGNIKPTNYTINYFDKYFWYKGIHYNNFFTNKTWKKFAKKLKHEEELKIFL